MKPSGEEEKSFDKGKYPITTVRGPIVFARLCGRTAGGRQNNPLGSYWFNPISFWNLLDELSHRDLGQHMVNHYMRYLIREFTAVSQDWNSFAQIYEFRVFGGQEIEVATGRAAAQFFLSMDDPHGRVQLLQHQRLGGTFQYVIHLGYEAHGRWVHGPRPCWINRSGKA